LFVALLAVGLSLAPTGARVRLELSGDGAFTYTNLTPSGPGSDTVTDEFGLAGNGRLRVSLYPCRPLIDDDAPLSLQPFLQRAFRVQASGGFFGSDTEVDSVGLDPTHQRSQSGFFQALAEGYPSEHLYAAASVQVQSSAFRISRPAMFGGDGPISTTLAVPVSASLGARVGDLLIAGTWTVTPLQTDSAPWRVRMPTPGLNAQVVVRRRWSFAASLTVLEGGAQASGGADLFFGRALDVFASVNGGHQTPAGGSTSDFAGGRVGAFFWQSRWFGAGLAYAPQWTRFGGVSTVSQVAHLLQLTVSSRPR
jgi:hypothetical protein